MIKRTGVDKSLFHVAKQKIGQPWTYTQETKAKLAAEMASPVIVERVKAEYDTTPSLNAGALLPKNRKHPLQQNNGRRSQCLGFKADFKVGNERNLPKPPKDFIAVARAKRIKKVTAKVRKAPNVSQ